MPDNIPAGMKTPFTIGDFKDAAGNSARIDQVIDIAVSDPAVADLVDVSADKLSGAIRRLADSDTIQTFTARIDGQRQAPGDPDVVGEFDLTAQFTCTSAPATGGAVTFGAPVPA